MMRYDRRMSIGRNKLALGLFGANCSGGLACSTFPERWDASWENNQALARMADEAGMDFMLPLGRWIGYGGDTNHNGSNFETLTWAAGILASTRDIMAFGTVHVTAINPVVAAKQMVTCDHIGQGRFGLNVICGWYQKEFDMLGIDLDTHDRRYDWGQEWVDIVTRAWSEDEPFDYDGEFFQTKGTLLEPKPFGRKLPPFINAATSELGREFAIKNADMLFMVANDPAKLAEETAALSRDAAALGREVGAFTNVTVTCRPTRKEAEEYLHYYAVEHADEGAVDTILKERGMYNRPVPDHVKQMFRLRAAAGNGALPLVGDPDDVAGKMKELSDAGISALAMGLPNYLDHFPYFRDEVLPRLERLGVRG